MTALLKLLVVGRWVKRITIAFLVLFVLFAAGAVLWAHHNYEKAGREMEKDDLAEARLAIERSLSVLPKSAQSNLRAARIYRKSWLYPQAEKCLTLYKELQGADEAFQLEWVLLRAQSGEFGKLESGLLACLGSGKDEAAVLECLSLCYINQLRFQSAHMQLDAWLKLDPKNPQALDWRGWVRERTSFYDGAIEDYQNAIKLAPDRWKCRVRLVRMLLGNQKLAEANEHLAYLEKTRPGEAEVLLCLGQRRTLEGKLEEARPLIDAAIAREPKNPSSLYERGKIEYQKGNFAAAEDWYRKSIALDPSYLHAQFALYNCLQQQGKKDEAGEILRGYADGKNEMKTLQELLEKIERSPDSNLLVQAGEIISRQGNDTLGSHFLMRALELNSANRRAHELLAAHYSKKNNREEADKHRFIMKQLQDR